MIIRKGKKQKREEMKKKIQKEVGQSKRKKRQLLKRCLTN